MANYFRRNFLLAGMVAGGALLAALNPSWNLLYAKDIERSKQLMRTEIAYQKERACDTATYLGSKQQFEYPEIDWIRKELKPEQFLSQFKDPLLQYAADNPTTVFGAAMSAPDAYSNLMLLYDGVYVKLPYPTQAYNKFLEETRGKTSISADLQSVSELRNGFATLCESLGSENDYTIGVSYIKEVHESGDRLRNGIVGAMLGFFAIVGSVALKRRTESV